jgi:hypothetical protein
MARRLLVTSDQAELAERQHGKPCSDCPFARGSLNGWLGGLSAEAWVAIAGGDHNEPCHVYDGAHCAGVAIYRANTAKLPRDRRVMRLPPDHERVFSNSREFVEHHRKPPQKFVSEDA